MKNQQDTAGSYRRRDIIARLKELGSYLIISSPVDEPERYISEIKHLERILISIRWLWIIILFITPLLYDLDQGSWMMFTGGMLALCNAPAYIFNKRIKTLRSQQMLGLVMLIVDTCFAWAIILLFVTDLDTAAYLSFIYVIIEAAVRYGLAGSLVMMFALALGLFGHYEYRLIVKDLPFSISSYLFWTTLTSIIAVSVGIIVQEGRVQRWKSEKYLRESTVLMERNRIARDLHDTVLKTLQGLSLEARALENRSDTTTPSVKETARYIGEVCSHTSREIRELILDLRTEDVETGIVKQISKLAEDWSQATGIAVEIKRSRQEVIVPAESSRHLRNIISEALTNIQRHASATLVRVVINITADALDIEIRDNGCGIGSGVEKQDTHIAGGKLGIAGMKERAGLLGGHLSLSSEESGTVVHVAAPLPLKTGADQQ